MEVRCSLWGTNWIFIYNSTDNGLLERVVNSASFWGGNFTHPYASEQNFAAAINNSKAIKRLSSWSEVILREITLLYLWWKTNLRTTLTGFASGLQYKPGKSNTVELHLSGLIGTASNPDLQKFRIIFFFVCKMCYIGSLKFGCYYLQYVPASKPFDHAWILGSRSPNTVPYLIR